MKHLFTITLIIFSLITTAQNTAKPSNIEGKDIYVLSVNTTPSSFVKNVQLTKEEIAGITDFESRIKTILNKEKNIDFDAIITRDGNTIKLVKYKSTSIDAKIPNYFGKEVYFFSTPTKKYKVVSSKEINATDLQKAFYTVANKYSKNDELSFDAVIISGNKAAYIQYK
ncbi:MAG: hypothetical protein P8Q14_12260 [Vicingaceae bacterium]|nr:hypothetical protein [Vicingaceae bacterium]